MVQRFEGIKQLSEEGCSVDVGADDRARVRLKRAGYDEGEVGGFEEEDEGREWC